MRAMFRRRLESCHACGGRRTRAVALWACAAALAAASACSQNQRSANWFRSQSTDNNLTMALEGDTPDQRRRGVNGLAGSTEASTDNAVRVFDVIARTDTDAMVRVAALRGLGVSADDRSVGTAVGILESNDAERKDVRPAPDVVRREAATLLRTIVDGYTYDESQRGDIVRVLVARARRDADRHVRLAAIDTLAYFAQRPIPTVLIEVMDTDDFAIQKAAEQSLIDLTGVTHRHDPASWRAWLSSVQDPFEHAGRPPAELARSNTDSWWPW